MPAQRAPFLAFLFLRRRVQPVALDARAPSQTLKAPVSFRPSFFFPPDELRENLGRRVRLTDSSKLGTFDDPSMAVQFGNRPFRFFPTRVCDEICALTENIGRIVERGRKKLVGAGAKRRA